MKVLFDHNLPFLLAHGGFQIQIEQTLHNLRKRGLDADWLRWWDESQEADIIHYFGKASSTYLQQARSKKIAVVINELHSELGSRPRWKHHAQGRIIGIANRSIPGLSTRMGWDVYRYADAIMALTPHEADLMSNVFHAAREKIYVISNGVEDVFLEDRTCVREDWLVCTAVIHPRKRVVEIAKAATLAEVPIRFYGRPYSESDSYYQDFLLAVKNSNGFVRFEGNVTSRPQLAEIYRRARGFVLCSTMESLSLSALEAAACRCPLLLSNLPWATSTFASSATYAPDTGDPSQLSRSLVSFYKNPSCCTEFKVASWGDIAEQIEAMYADVVKRVHR